MDSDPDSSSTMACVWWRNPQPSVDSKQGESTRGRRKEGERDERNLSQINLYEEKGHPNPPYIGQGGVPPPLHFRGGTNPKGGGFWHSPRGWAPSWRHG